MTRLGIGMIGAAALVSAACMGSTRSAKAGSEGNQGKMIATAAQSGAASGPASANAGASASASAAKPKEVEGRVERIDRANNVTLAGAEQAGLAFDQFKVDGDTKITVNGEEATLSQVNPGDEVRASLSGQADELHVDKLDVVSSGGTASPGSASQPSTPSDQGSGSSDQKPDSSNDTSSDQR